MSTDETYNGWTNWETWNTALWLDNDEAPYNEARRIVGTTAYPDLALRALAEATVRDAVDFDRVDWPEIVAHFREE